MADTDHTGTSLTGGHANAVAGGAAGFLSGADKTKLDGIDAAAKIGGTLGAVDNTVPRSDGAGTKTAQASALVIDDTGLASGITVANTAATQPANLGQLRTITFDVAATVSLPSYTYSNGSSGVGATITTASNVALPVVNGYAPAVNDRVLLPTGAALADNGLYDITQLADGSTIPTILTRSTFADTPAKLAQLVLVASTKGVSGAGAIWVQPLRAADITIGTTALIFTRLTDGFGATPRGIDIYEDYTSSVASPANNTLLGGRGGMCASFSGTGAAVAFNNTGTGNTSTEVGIATCTTGSLASGIAGSQNGGASFAFATNAQIYIAAKFNLPTASTGAQQYTTHAGAVSGGYASGVWTAADATVNPNYQLIVKSVTTAGTTTTTGTTPISGGTTYDIVEIVKAAGTNQIHWYVNRILQPDPATTNVPVTDLVFPYNTIDKAVGITTAATKKDDFYVCKVDFPLGRAG